MRHKLSSRSLLVIGRVGLPRLGILFLELAGAVDALNPQHEAAAGYDISGFLLLAL